MTDPARPVPKACIIGAGCSGFSTAKALKDRVIATLRAQGLQA